MHSNELKDRIERLQGEHRGLTQHAMDAPLFQKAKFIERAAMIQLEINELQTKAIFMQKGE